MFMKCEDITINCVKRMSDNQLFYVGEETNFGKIKGFEIEKSGMWVLYLKCDSQKLGDIQHVNEKFEIISFKKDRCLVRFRYNLKNENAP